jgi:HEAT repeat protein
MTSLRTAEILALVLALTNVVVAGDDPTRSDIPRNLPPELKALIEQTFSPEPKTRAGAATQLGKMGEQAAPAIPFLIRLLSDSASISKHDYVSVSSAAREALAAIGPSVVEPLLASLRESSGQRRRVALFALERVEDRRIVPQLLLLLTGSDEDIREHAARSLESYLKDNPRFRKTPGLTQSLVRVLQDKNPEIRSYVVGAIGECRDRDALEPLLKMLEDPEYYVRFNVVTALGKLGDPRARDALRETLHTASSKIHQYGLEGFAAAKSLGQVRKDKHTLVLLLGLAESPFEAVDIRCGAISGLAELGDRAAVKPLTEIVEQKSREPKQVRTYAISAIVDLRGAEATPALKRWALDEAEVWSNRYLAAKKLVKLTRGSVDDIVLVDIIASHYGDDQEGSRLALREIAKHGKTGEIRAAAERKLRKEE